ncbi:hypothetical protein DL93DRAFT_2234158 [Clavulina sp. PMI_390]|nr:hypothetical protein DL93DRAFT_2234158 [Clavulina sp. PMI_390]
MLSPIQKRPLHAMITEYVLDFRSSFPASPSVLGRVDSDVDYLAPILLPGGRWIISGILDYESHSVHVCCWDSLTIHSDDAPLQPAADFIWTGFDIHDRFNWVQEKLDGTDSVTLACCLSVWERQETNFTLSYEILSLKWKAGSAVPVFEEVARLPPDSHVVDESYSEYRLEGDYLIMENTRSIVIWDWRNNRIGRIDNEQHEWANGSGFLTAVDLPYVFVLPHRLREILVIEIPQLHPLGSPKPFEHIFPASNISYPLLDEIEGLRSSTLHILDRWKPPSRRSGIVILRSKLAWREEDFLFQVISLNPTHAVPPKPSYANHQARSFPRDSDEVDTMTVVNGVGVVLLRSPLDFTEADEPLDTLFYRFNKDGGLETPVERRFSNFFKDGGIVAPICFVSGKTLVKSRDGGPEPYTQVVEMVSFDFRDQDSI